MARLYSIFTKLEPKCQLGTTTKIDLIRKVYKKFLTIPTENIEVSWSQYTKWEMN